MREISKIENGSSLLKCVVLTSSVEDSSERLLEVGGLFPSVLGFVFDLWNRGGV
jgi:hypothetical protein